MKKLIIAAIGLAVVLASHDATAIPEIQLYIPGSTYITSSDAWADESWFSENTSFNLQVLVTEKFNSLALVVAVPDNECNSGSTNTITLNGISYGVAGFTDGTPIMGYDKKGKPVSMPSHGVYDTCYFTYNIGPITTLNDQVYNEVDKYLGGSDIKPKPGEIINFSVVNSGFTKAHFDAFGTNIDGKIKFAPFSHDAEDGPIPPPRVPEPATLSLLGLGLFAFAVRKKRSWRLGR